MNNKTAASPPRVLMVIRWPVGGIRTHVRYLLRRLANEYQYTIVAPSIEEFDALAADVSGLNVKVISAKTPRRRHIPTLVKIILSTALKEKFELIHCQGLTSGILALPVAKLKRIPIVVTLHDMFLPNQFKGWIGRLRKCVVATALPRFDAVHVVSEDARINLLENFPRMERHEKKVIAIRSGIDVDRFRNPSPRNLRDELSLSADDFLIGFLGRFMSPKGFGYLVGAMRDVVTVPDLPKRPVVLAFGAGGYIREDQARVDQLGLSDSFRFLPFTPNVASTIAGLDVVVMPSVWEACGLLAMEAMVAGVPVIGTDCIGLREVIRDTPARMVRARDSAGLGKAIVQEIRHPATSEARAFAEIAAGRFDVGAVVLKVKSIYSTLLDPRGAH